MRSSSHYSRLRNREKKKKRKRRETKTPVLLLTVRKKGEAAEPVRNLLFPPLFGGKGGKRKKKMCLL